MSLAKPATYWSHVAGISEGAQFVKGVPKAPSAVPGAEMTVKYRPMSATTWDLEGTEIQGGRSGPAAGRPQGKP
jgi:hypothetical protein